MEKALLFTNWTDEDFSWKWGGVPYTIKSRESHWMEDWKASHFSKHLVDRELTKQNLPTDHWTRNNLIEKCVSVNSIEAEDSSKLTSVVLDKNLKEKKRGRPPKEKDEEENLNPEFKE